MSGAYRPWAPEYREMASSRPLDVRPGAVALPLCNFAFARALRLALSLEAPAAPALGVDVAELLRTRFSSARISLAERL